MKISKNLPQFEKEQALVVVLGKQEGKFYLANKGIIEEVSCFKFSKPKYSDREGRFIKRGKGGIYKSGAVYEAKKERILTELANRTRDNLKEIMDKNKVDGIYVFCLAHLKNQLNDSFPASARQKIKLSLSGDYFHYHPHYLLKKIADKIDSEKKPALPLKESALKILKKTERDKSVK